MLRFLGFCALTALLIAPATGQDNAPIKFDGLLNPEQMNALKGSNVVIRLSSGVTIDDAKLLGFTVDPQSGASRFVQYQTGARRPKVKVTDIHRMLIDGKLYRFRYTGATKSYYLIDIAAAADAIKQRLQGQGSALRDPQTKQQIEEGVADLVEIFNQAERDLAPRKLVRLETRYTLILTDFPVGTAQQAGKYMDGVCEHLNGLFGLPHNSNIWRGKAMIAIFQERGAFGEFNSKSMDNPNYGKMVSIFYHNSRRFLYCGNWKALSRNEIRGLCEIIAGGYVARYRSDVGVPPWLSQGIQKVVVQKAFPDPKQIASQAASFREELNRAKSLNGLLSADDLKNKRGNDCGNIVSLLIESDIRTFSEFFEDVKLGLSCEDALKLNYGMDYQQFAAALGNHYGVPNVTP